MAGLSNIGKIQASLASATQETTLALFNFNFDWSIFKVEAPAEYKPVGTALTTTRRNQAEAGAAHRTARKLGSLFEDIIPDTPELIRAYGIRATEIVKFHDDIASKKKRSASDYGAFAEYVGVDGTSIWAAATSSPAAITVHLLACILARAFPAAEAVAIWEQIVEERKGEVSKFDDNGSIPIKHLRGLMASSWEIPRSDLASWDSSARAWTRSADAAKEFHCHQIRLIIDNINLPVHTSLDVYKSVMETWTTCMQLMNNLIRGNGQAVYNGALLVAFRAWHIFPDLIILKDGQLVRQNDPLVKPGGRVTIGLERAFKDENGVGVNWTLSLTHYRYYADQEIREGVLNSTKDRITVEDMWMFLVGYLMAFIDLNIADLDYVCTLIQRLYSIIWEPLENTQLSITFQLTWLYRISQACMRYNDAREDRAYLKKLVSLGYKSFKKSFPGTVKSLKLSIGDVFKIVKPNSHLPLLKRLLWKTIKSGRTDMVVRYDCADIEESVDQFAISSVAIEHPNFESPVLILTPINEIDLDKSYNRFYAYFQLSNPVETLMVYGDLLPTHAVILEGLIDGLDVEKIRVLSDRSRFIAALQLENVPSALILFEGSKAKTSRHSARRLERELRQNFGPPGTKNSANNISKNDFEFMLQSGMVDAPFIWALLIALPGRDVSTGHRNPSESPLGCLQEMASVSRLYDKFEEPLIDLSVLSTCFPAVRFSPTRQVLPASLLWPPSLDWMFEFIKPFIGAGLLQSQAFQWIHYLETKGVWLGRQMPEQVMAISSENSLFVASQFLSDPSECDRDAYEPDRIIRLPGNIGKPGVVIIVPTEINRMPPKEDTLVEDASFDGQLIDCYRNTTLHLTLTGYELPLQEIKKIGLRHQMTWIVGAATSVYESGNWIGDINPFKIYDTTNQLLHRSANDAEICTNCGANEAKAYEDMREVHIEPAESLTSIDCWDEYFNRSWNVTVFRSKGNWAARLAAICFGAELQTLTLLLDPATCHCEIDRIFAQKEYEKYTYTPRQGRKRFASWTDTTEDIYIYPEEMVGRGDKADTWSETDDITGEPERHSVNIYPVIIL